MLDVAVARYQRDYAAGARLSRDPRDQQWFLAQLGRHRDGGRLGSPRRHRTAPGLLSRHSSSLVGSPQQERGRSPHAGAGDPTPASDVAVQTLFVLRRERATMTDAFADGDPTPRAVAASPPLPPPPPSQPSAATPAPAAAPAVVEVLCPSCQLIRHLADELLAGDAATALSGQESRQRTLWEDLYSSQLARLRETAAISAAAPPTDDLTTAVTPARRLALDARDVAAASAAAPLSTASPAASAAPHASPRYESVSRFTRGREYMRAVAASHKPPPLGGVSGPTGTPPPAATSASPTRGFADSA